METDPVSQHQSFVMGLRQTLPYLKEFHQQLFVIQVQGSFLQNASMPAIFSDLILLHRIGIKIILVHDVDESNVASENWQILQHLHQYHRHVIPFTGIFLDIPSASGEAFQLRQTLLKQSLQQNHFTVVPSVGMDTQGNLQKLDAVQVAQEIACQLHVSKWIVLTSEDFAELSSLPSFGDCTPSLIKEWLAEHSELSSQLTQLLSSLTHACERGVRRCHLLSLQEDGVLLKELLTSAGAGIMITQGEYTQIRAAQNTDLSSIWALTQQSMAKQQIVHRRLPHIQNRLEHYRVFCMDEAIVGTCEWILFEEEEALEIGNLVVREDYRNRGIARGLIQDALQHAMHQGLKQVFALSTQASHIFLNAGFQEVSPKKLPVAKKDHYDFAASKVFQKCLG